MSYYDLPKGSPDMELGRRIYMEALEGRRGFRYDQLGIEDAEIWAEVFEAIGSVARAALALPAAAGWQTMESAPKDGTRVITYSGGLVGTSRYTERFAPQYGDTSPGWYSDHLDRRHHPIAWMPLPVPPTSKTGGDPASTGAGDD